MKIKTLTFTDEQTGEVESYDVDLIPDTGKLWEVDRHKNGGGMLHFYTIEGKHILKQLGGLKWTYSQREVTVQ